MFVTFATVMSTASFAFTPTVEVAGANESDALTATARFGAAEGSASAQVDASSAANEIRRTTRNIRIRIRPAALVAWRGVFDSLTDWTLRTGTVMDRPVIDGAAGHDVVPARSGRVVVSERHH